MLKPFVKRVKRRDAILTGRMSIGCIDTLGHDALGVELAGMLEHADDQATIMLSLVRNHGRSTPLVWLTVDKATLKNHRNAGTAVDLHMTAVECHLLRCFAFARNRSQQVLPDTLSLPRAKQL